MAPSAPNLRRRPCYANSHLLQLPRLRLQRPRWRRPPPLPGAVMVGTVVGIAAAGAVPASSSVARPIMVTATAAAMSDDWSRRRGVPAGAWSIAAIDRKSSILDVKSPGLSLSGLFCEFNQWNPPQRSLNFYYKCMQSVSGGKKFPLSLSCPPRSHLNVHPAQINL